MTETRQAEQIRGALGGIVIALATLIAIFAFYTLARAQTPSTNLQGATGATTVNNGANSAIGASSSTMPSTGTANGSSMDASGASVTNGMGANASGAVNGTGTTGSANVPLVAAPPPAAPAPMVLSIGNGGTALIRGVVTAISGTGVTIATWGGSWQIAVTPYTQVIPTSGVAAIHVGDFVGADGVIASHSDFTVNASVLRDWTIAPAPVATGTSGSAASGGASSTAPATNASGTTGATTSTNATTGTGNGATGSMGSAPATTSTSY